MLDTSVLIAGERRRFDLEGFFRAYEHEEFYLSSIAASELLRGAALARTPKQFARHARFAEALIGRFPVVAFDLAAAREHSRLWATLRRAGTPVGAHDLLIAATANARGCSLATLNTKEFARIDALSLVAVDQFRVP